MSANTNPIFNGTPSRPGATLAAANTARDGSGSLVLLFTAHATYGSRIDYIKFTSATLAVGTPSLKVCRIFVTDSAGANPRLEWEILLAATASSNTTIGATSTYTFPGGFVIQAGELVYVTQSVYAGVADQVHVAAQGGHFYLTP